MLFLKKLTTVFLLSTKDCWWNGYGLMTNVVDGAMGILVKSSKTYRIF